MEPQNFKIDYRKEIFDPKKWYQEYEPLFKSHCNEKTCKEWKWTRNPNQKWKCIYHRPDKSGEITPSQEFRESEKN